MELLCEIKDDVAIVRVPTKGLLVYDQAVMSAISAKIDELTHGTDKKHKIAIDVSNACYADSVAVGQLVELHRKLAQQGVALKLVGPTKIFMEILQRTGLDTALSIHATEAEALSSNWVPRLRK